MEVDIVAHGGTSAEGEYLHSLNLLDIETRWNEFVGLANRSQASVTAAVDGCRRRLPFQAPQVGSWYEATMLPR
jgi:hypothetical protein